MRNEYMSKKFDPSTLSPEERDESFKKAMDKEFRLYGSAGLEILNHRAQIVRSQYYGTPMPEITPHICEISFRAAANLFLNGKVRSRKVRQMLEDMGLDVTDLRHSILEATLANAIPRIIQTGDLDALARLSKLAGETTLPDQPQTQPQVVKYITVAEAEAVDAHIDNVIGNGN